jgi:hypothetical protein
VHLRPAPADFTILSGIEQDVETAAAKVADSRRWMGRMIMLWTICVILIVLWLLGIISSYTMGGFIHILLVIAIIVVLVRVIQGRRVL